MYVYVRNLEHGNIFTVKSIEQTQYVDHCMIATTRKSPVCRRV